ncbi:MAG: PD40 domain-containing protein, partial [Crocinitomicaceae bacterium]|nr:PD40 domain-containing protein [Crocinitomicaceae bacterium]
FEEAKKNYKEYQRKSASKEDKRFHVDREIEMCDNGKKLLSTFTDIIVAEKLEIDQSKFFRLYSDAKTIGGDILVTLEFQSKLDKKMGHIPVVHYPPQAKAIYYASYGNNMSTGKDIYIRRKLPDGKWGKPQLVPGEVNTNEDEDYPYMHPSGKFLYFSSTGHNSMGGYDVFMSRFNPNINAFTLPENVDFAISSPDDDLFYVVDSLFQNAYFASSRQSQDGKIHVYKVKVARVPIQEVIVMGEFKSEVNPENKNVYVKLKAHSSGKDVGALKSNAAGKYSFVFPQGGKYEYLIDIEGSENQYKFIVDFPYLAEFRPLKQKILHTIENGEEIVRIINLFDEEVEGSEAIIAEIIRKKSELEVNIDQFDINAIEAEEKRKAVLAEMGFANMSLDEVSDQLEIVKETVGKNVMASKLISSNINAEILEKSDRVIVLNGIQKELNEKASNTDDAFVRHKLLSDALNKEEKKRALIKQIDALKDLNETVEEKLKAGTENGGTSIVEIEKQFNALKDADKEDDALQVLIEHKNVIKKAKSTSANEILQDYVEENIQLREERKNRVATENEYVVMKDKLDAQIKLLSAQKEGAKKKEQEKLQGQIDSKAEELAMVEEEIKNVEEQIIQLEYEIGKKEDQILSLQNALTMDDVADVDPQKIKEAIENVEKIERIVATTDYENELAKIERENPDVKRSESSKDEISIVQETNELQEQRILNDNNLTELKQLYRLIENNEGSIRDIEVRIKKINNELARAEDNGLIEEKGKLEEYKNELNQKNRGYETRVEQIKEITPEVVMPKEDVIEEIVPSYEKEIAAINSNSELSELEKLEEIQEEQRNLNSSVSMELEETNQKLKSNPNDQESLARKAILEDIKSEVAQEITRTENQIDQLNKTIASTKGSSTDEVIKDVAPDYSDRVKEIQENNDLAEVDKQIQLQSEDERLLTDIQEEKEEVNKN